MHVFELAGLGQAPFKCTQMSVGTIHSCQYCGTAIVYNFHIQSSDGKSFIVGSDCVMKTNDIGLTRVVDFELKKLRKQQAKERIAKTQDAITTNPALIEALKNKPHPNNWPNRTMLDWATWMLRNSGTSGSLKVCRKVEPILKTLHQG